jgi:hypothetical protein
MIQFSKTSLLLPSIEVCSDNRQWMSEQSFVSVYYFHKATYKNLSNLLTLLFNAVQIVILSRYRLCGLLVSVADYKHRGPGFDSRALLRIFLRELGLERGPLSLVIG